MRVLLGLEDEMAPAVEVDEVGDGRAGDFDGELETVAVGVAVGRVGDANELGEPEEEALGVGPLIGLGLLPVSDEGLGSVKGSGHGKRGAMLGIVPAIHKAKSETGRGKGGLR